MLKPPMSSPQIDEDVRLAGLGLRNTAERYERGEQRGTREPKDSSTHQISPHFKNKKSDTTGPATRSEGCPRRGNVSNAY